jgi:hypothetical protein
MEKPSSEPEETKKMQISYSDWAQQLTEAKDIGESTGRESERAEAEARRAELRDRIMPGLQNEVAKTLGKIRGECWDKGFEEGYEHGYSIGSEEEREKTGSRTALPQKKRKNFGIGKSIAILSIAGAALGAIALGAYFKFKADQKKYSSPPIISSTASPGNIHILNSPVFSEWREASQYADARDNLFNRLVENNLLVNPELRRTDDDGRVYAVFCFPQNKMEEILEKPRQVSSMVNKNRKGILERTLEDAQKNKNGRFIVEFNSEGKITQIYNSTTGLPYDF